MGMGKQLDKILKAEKVNVNQLANELGIRAQRIYNIINRDTKRVQDDLINKIADTLGISVAFFYLDESDNSSIEDYRVSANKCLTEGQRFFKNLSLLLNSIETDSDNIIQYSTLETYYNSLNERGKFELIKRAEEMTRLNEYVDC